MSKEKNIGAKIAITIEIILIIIFIWSYIAWNAECEGLSCLGKILPYLLIRASGILAVINLFIIQILRKKNLVFPIIVVLCIISVFLLKIMKKNVYIKTTRFEPENSFDNIFYNDFSESSKYIYYFVHNNYLYYYKYDEKYIDFETDEKGILFKTDFKLNKTDKVCELNSGMSFYFDFIYGNEVFYTTREKGCETCGLSYHNSLKRLNLDTCEEKIITNYDETTSGEWEYILGSRNKDEILFYDSDSDSDGDVLYKYNLKDNRIVKLGKVRDTFDLVDYDTFDYYYTTYEGIYYNDSLIYKSNDFKYNLLSFDAKNIYLYDNNYEYIYVLNKESKQIVEKKNFQLKNINSINNIKMFMNNYLYIDNKIYQYNIDSNSFVSIFDNIKEDNLGLFSELFSEQRNINGYYLFCDISGLNSFDSDPDIEDSAVVLSIYDNKGNNIIKEYNNGNLINYFIDNDDIYLVYNDYTFKKIETKS